jgi:hypothetical protein
MIHGMNIVTAAGADSLPAVSEAMTSTEFSRDVNGLKLCVADCVTDCVRLAVPQATEWQRIGNQIDAAMIFARADFVSMLVHHLRCRCWIWAPRTFHHPGDPLPKGEAQIL